MSALRFRRARAVMHRAAAGLSDAARRAVADGWRLLQATASATAAWLVARYVLDHPAPYFAPVSAMIALTAHLGERGLHAIRLLKGVLPGLLVGELVLGVFVALTAACVIGGPQVVLVQAGVSTVLVEAPGDQSNGVQRLVDMLIGAGIALVFTRILFPPEPLALLRRAEKAALTAIADGLATTADAIARDDDELAERAVGEFRDVQDRLAELRRVGRAGTSVTRRALVWRATVVVREKENSEHLGLPGASCLTLARLVASADSGPRGRFQQPVRDLADVIASLDAGSADSDRTFLAHSLRMVATDVIAFAGVDLTDAIKAIRAGALEQRVPPTAPAPGRRLLGWPRRHRGKARRQPARSGPSGWRPPDRRAVPPPVVPGEHGDPCARRADGLVARRRRPSDGPQRFGLAHLHRPSSEPARRHRRGSGMLPGRVGHGDAEVRGAVCPRECPLIPHVGVDAWPCRRAWPLTRRAERRPPGGLLVAGWPAVPGPYEPPGRRRGPPPGRG